MIVISNKNFAPEDSPTTVNVSRIKRFKGIIYNMGNILFEQARLQIPIKICKRLIFLTTFKNSIDAGQ